MKNKYGVIDHQISIDEKFIGEFPLKYKSIKGVVRSEEQISNMLLPKFVSVDAYSTHEMSTHPFYKPISKII